MKRILALTAMTAVFIASTAQGQVTRTNELPNVGQLFVNGTEQKASGDAWTFLCPQGFTAKIFVDNKNDNDNDTDGDENTGNVDLVAEAFDNNGNIIAFGDDNRNCSFAQVCGFECPEVEFVCTSAAPKKTIEVRDFGTAQTSRRDGGTEMACKGGGGYVITVQVTAPDGTILSEKSMELGGGAARDVPQFITDIGSSTSPLLDDEELPGGRKLTKPSR